MDLNNQIKSKIVRKTQPQNKTQSVINPKRIIKKSSCFSPSLAWRRMKYNPVFQTINRNKRNQNYPYIKSNDSCAVSPRSDWMSLSERYIHERPTLDNIAQIRANITLK